MLGEGGVHSMVEGVAASESIERPGVKKHVAKRRSMNKKQLPLDVVSDERRELLSAVVDPLQILLSRGLRDAVAIDNLLYDDLLNFFTSMLEYSEPESSEDISRVSCEDK